MTFWKVLALVGMLAFFVLFTMSLAGDIMLVLLSPALGATNFSVLCLILEQLQKGKD